MDGNEKKKKKAASGKAVRGVNRANQQRANRNAARAGRIRRGKYFLRHEGKTALAAAASPLKLLSRGGLSCGGEKLSASKNPSALRYVGALRA